MLSPLLIGPLGPFEILVILGVGLLIFGSRLPEVGRSLGKGFVEFKRGLKGVQDEVHAMEREADRQVDHELERREHPTNPAEEHAPFHDQDEVDEALAPIHPEDDEFYEDDPSREPGPEFGGDPQPDADPPTDAAGSSSASEGTEVYMDPDYLDGETKPDEDRSEPGAAK